MLPDKVTPDVYAHEQAFEKLWPLFGFLLAEDRYREGAPNEV